MSVKAFAVTDVAFDVLSRNVPYVPAGKTLAGMDCQGFIKYCVKQAGGNCDHYSGSNAMFRASIANGTIQPYDTVNYKDGMCVYIVKHDDKEPSKYKGDGYGNCSHVGLAVEYDINICSIDSSETYGGVRSRTESECKKTWTHMGWLPEIDYSADGASSTVDKPSTVAGTPPKATDIYQPDDFEPMDEDSDGEAWNPADTELEGEVSNAPTVSNKPVTSNKFPYEAIVTTAQGVLNLRKTPSAKGELRGKAEKGSSLMVYAEESHEGVLWGQTYKQGFDGVNLKCWFKMEFVTKKAAPPPAAPEPTPAPLEPTAPATPAAPSLGEKINAIEKLVGIIDKLSD
jgi:hypothetical protein